ncbi:MAG: LTA synthase family protein [Candidatus Marinimicrobia bacterium]|nr:LTA synthase family protein [Candidatus Neomarinimicrobiota bacterium]MBT5211476.1 LTA synthase family protein [Candidatus Neomarinimicrobiota bacterium]
MGIRLDMVIAGYIVIPLFFSIFLPVIGWKSKIYQIVYQIYMMFAIVLISFLHLFDLQFYKEFGGHINFMILHNMRNQEEIWKFFWNEYPLIRYSILLIIILFISSILLLYLRRVFPYKLKSSLIKKTALILLSFTGIVLACRGGWQERPINWGYAIFSENMDVNQSALNGIFFFGRSIVELSSEKNLSETLSYYTLEESERVTNHILNNVDNSNNFDTLTFDNPNIVIIILESHTGALCGYLDSDYENVTPRLDDMAKNGISFTRCYSSGHRSAHGIGSILTGLPTLPGLPLIYQVEALNGLPTIGSIFQEEGYTTSFFYGGDANYDNMKGFAKINGFQNVLDQNDFPDNSAGTSWGKYDHILFETVSNFHRNMTEPFLSVIFTTTNHQPWRVPKEFDINIKEFKDSKYNRSKTMSTMNYVDKVIGDFIEQSKDEDWFDNTIFVFTADHGLRNNYRDRDDLVNAIIPLVVYSPGLIKNPTTVNKVCSQADILPLILGMTDIDLSRIKLKGSNPLLKKSGFACRIVNDQVYWIEDNYVYKEILNQQQYLYKFSVENGQTLIDDSIMLEEIQKRCRSYLQNSYFSFKNLNTVQF